MADQPIPSERPILFNGEMVRAILDGRKTQTRRVLKPQPSGSALSLIDGDWHWNGVDRKGESRQMHGCPHGKPGDRLWVKESFRLRRDQDNKKPSEDWWKSGAWYEADGPDAQPSGCAGGAGRLRPSIFMPRWASRITLEVKAVRVERLNEVMAPDAMAEGMCYPDCDGCDGEDPAEGCLDVTQLFASLWDSINAKRGFGWDSNPWVWVVEFARMEGTNG